MYTARTGYPHRGTRLLYLVAAFILILLIVILVLILILLVVLILIAILLIHGYSSKISSCGLAAIIECPNFYALSLGLKIKLARRPAITATVIPPAQAFRPPVKIPRKPSASMASFTPFAKL